MYKLNNSLITDNLVNLFCNDPEQVTDSKDFAQINNFHDNPLGGHQGINRIVAS